MSTTAQPMLARRAVRLAAVAALRRLPGITIDSPGAWDSQPVSLPQIMVRVQNEAKRATGKQLPEFVTSVVLEVSARVQAQTVADAQDAIEALGQQIEFALLGNVAFVGQLQRVSEVASRCTVDATGMQPIGALLMAVTCETFEHFDPVVIAYAQYPSLDQMHVHVDTTGQASPTGTFHDHPFTAAVMSSPRTHGPDGRDEAQLQINL